MYCIGFNIQQILFNKNKLKSEELTYPRHKNGTINPKLDERLVSTPSVKEVLKI